MSNPPPNSKAASRQIEKSWPLSVFFTAAAALVWAQFRSYDLLDGGCYYLLYQNPADNPDRHTHFVSLARPVWLICGQNIIAFRIACLGLLSVAVMFFWHRWLRLLPGAPDPLLSGLILWLSAMASLCWVPVALTYNSLATLFSLIGFAILIPMMGPASNGAVRPVGRWAQIIVIGGLVAGLLLVKPPAALAFIGACWFLLCFDEQITAQLRRLLIWSAVLVAVVSSTTLIVVLRSNLDPSRLYHIGGFRFSLSWVHGTLLRYSREIDGLLPALRGDFIWTAGPIVLAIATALPPATNFPRLRRWRAAGLGLLLVSFSGAFFARRLWNGSFSTAVSGEAARFYILTWGSLLPLWLLSLREGGRDPMNPAKRLVAWAWIPVFFALPLLGSVGTTNTLYVAALHETVFWSAGLILAASQIALSLQAPWFRTGVTIWLGMGATCHLFTGQFWSPYMHQPPLWRQTEPTMVGHPATTIRLDPAMAHFLKDVRTVLDENGYRPGEDVFGFFNLPGLIFAIGAKEPGAPWYFGTWYHQSDNDGGKLRQIPIERRRAAWILTQADVTPFRPQFLQAGFDFPNGYRKIGMAINPTTGLEIGIWKPIARP